MIKKDVHDSKIFLVLLFLIFFINIDLTINIVLLQNT